MYAFRNTSRRTLALVSLLTAFFSAPSAIADDAAEVSNLMRAGRLGDALTKVDGALAQRPRDPQMRFLKGLILTEQNKSQEAIVVFTKLTEDFPDLPEPYNNLAVLFASAGQYDKARAALDMAIRTNPTYATAHENLGDVYAKLASQAYDKALQIDSGNAGARSKLTLVRTLTGNATGGAVPVKVAAAATSPAMAQAATAPAVSAAAGAASKTVPPPAKTAAAVPAPAKVEAAAGERDSVIEALNNWAKAWSDQDTKNYLASYASSFKTPNGVSRAKWESERKARIEGKERISVKIDAPQVSLNGDSATVRFRQTYESDRLNNVSAKTLVFTKQNGKWLIQQERSGG